MKKIQGDGGAQPGRPPYVPGPDFDFPQLAAAPIYQALIRAVSDAAGNATVDLLTAVQWAKLLGVLGEAARYGDRCRGCGRDLVFPFRARYSERGATMTYLCGCGNTWFTSYGKDW